MNTDKIIEPLSVDCVIFGFEDEELKVLLIKRLIDSTHNSWALPGGFIKYSETIETAAERVLKEKTGVSLPFMEQFGVFSEVDRFPEKRVITIAYYALIKPEDYKISIGHDANDARWVNLNKLPKLTFDHNEIIESAHAHLKAKVRYEPIGFNLLPNKFALLSLQKLYETILDIEFDKPNFRRKIIKMDILTQLNEKQVGVAHRAPKLYQFNIKKYNAMKEKGFNFEVF